MADTIAKGITIEFKGDTLDFDKGVSKINGELKSLKAETKTLNRELKLDPNNFDKLSQKLTNLKQQEKLLTEELNAYDKALASMDKNSKEFEVTERKARNLRIELEYVNRSIESMGGNKLGLALKTVGTNLQNLGNNVSKLGKSFSLLSSSASAVILAFGKGATDLVTFADDINTLSKQTGLSTETLQAFGQMANLIDVDLDTLSKSAVYLTKNLDTKGAQENYKKLGISIKDANGNYKDSETLLFETLTALQKVEDETTRSIIANDLFGKSYSNLGSIINDASVDLDSITDQVKKNGLILSQDELDKLNEVNDNIDTFKMIVDGVGKSLIADFQEPLAEVTSYLTDLATKVKDFVNGLSKEQKEKILKIIGIVATISPLLVVVGTAISTVGKFVGGLSSAVGVLSPILSTVFTTLSTNPLALVVVGVVALTSAIVWLYENFDTVKEKVGAVWEKFKQTEWVQNLIDFFDKLKETLDNVIESIKGVFNWLTDTIGKVGEFFSTGISSIGGWFSGLFKSGGFGNNGLYASGGYGALELNTTINVNNNGASLSTYQAQQFGRQIVDYVNEKLGRRI